jgi:recombination protein RecA
MIKKGKEKQKELSGIELLKKTLAESVKGIHVEILQDSNIAKIEKWLQGPSYDINRIISGSLFKGFPEKSVTCLVAPEGVFKSSLMAITAADAQKNGYIPVIIDTEGAFTSDFCERWGLDTSNMLYIYTIFIEEITTLLGTLIDNKDENLFIILDSLGGIESKKIIKDTTSGTKEAKADQGQLAKKIKRMLKMLVSIIKSQNSMAMFSGHWYGKPDSYGSAEEIGGGKYVKLASDIIMAMKKTPILLDPNAKYNEREIIGSEINICTLKNRYYPPFNESKVEINYQDGINRFAGLEELAFECDLVKRAGSWFTLPDDTKVQGAHKVTKWIKNNPDTIINKLENFIKETGYSTVNENVKEAERLRKETQKEFNNGNG